MVRRVKPVNKKQLVVTKTFKIPPKASHSRSLETHSNAGTISKDKSEKPLRAWTHSLRKESEMSTWRIQILSTYSMKRVRLRPKHLVLRPKIRLAPSITRTK